MDFSISSIGHPPLQVTCGLLVIVLLPLLSLPLLTGRPRPWFWSSAAPMLYVLLPLFVGSSLAFWMLLQTFRGLAISGATALGAVSAGMSEALMGLVYGAAAAGAMALIALVRAWMNRGDATARADGGTLILAAAGVPFAAGSVLLVLLVIVQRPQVPSPIYYSVFPGIWGSLAILALSVVRLLILRRRQPGSEIPWRWHVRTLSAALATCAVLGSAAWIVAHRLWLFARTGAF